MRVYQFRHVGTAVLRLLYCSLKLKRRNQNDYGGSLYNFGNELR